MCNNALLLEHEIPDLITGDFDSANMDNVQYFKVRQKCIKGRDKKEIINW